MPPTQNPDSLFYLATAVSAERKPPAPYSWERGMRYWEYVRLPNTSAWLIVTTHDTAFVDSSREEAYAFVDLASLRSAVGRLGLRHLQIFIFVPSRLHIGVFTDAFMKVDQIYCSEDLTEVAYVTATGLAIVDTNGRQPMPTSGLAPVFRQGKFVSHWHDTAL